MVELSERPKQLNAACLFAFSKTGENITITLLQKAVPCSHQLKDLVIKGFICSEA